MSVAQNEQHRCRICGKTPDEAKFRLNGSGFYRATCNPCEAAANRQRRTAPPRDPEPPPVEPSYAVMPYNGAQIAWDGDGGMVCLTDLWRAAGSPESNRPNDWLATAQAQEYVAVCRRRGLIAVGDGNYSRAGAHGGTWREKIIGLPYAQYLSPDLYVACNLFILDQWGEARATLPPQASIQRLADELTAMRQAIALLPGLDERSKAILTGVAGIKGDIEGARVIEREQVWRGQIYIGLLTYEPLLTMLRRDYSNIPPGAEIVFVGRTAPSGSVHDLRLKDYGGKFKVRSDDYELLTTFGTDDPEGAENLLLHNPMRGCKRLRGSEGASKTFIATTGGAERQYAALTAKHYTRALLQLVVTGIGDQMGMFTDVPCG